MTDRPNGAAERFALVDRAGAALLAGIVSLDLAPGSRHAVDALSDRYGTGPDTSCAGLCSVQATGLATIERDFVTVTAVSRAEAYDIIDTHRLLRLHAVEIASNRLDLDDAAELKTHYADYRAARKAGNVLEWIDASRRFNRVVYHKAENGELCRLIELTEPQVYRLSSLVLADAQSDFRSSLYEGIIDGAEQHDPREVFECYCRAWGMLRMAAEETPADLWKQWSTVQ